MSIKIIATVFPTIALVLGAGMLTVGNTSGWPLIGLGAVAQGAYLFMR